MTRPQTPTSWSAALALGWSALCLSVVGDQILDYVLLVESSARPDRVSAGLLGLAVGVPVLLGGLVGSLVDRHAPRMPRLIGVVVGTGALSLLAIWTAWPGPGFGFVLYPLAGIVALVSIAVTTMWNVILPPLVGHDRERMKAAAGRTSIVVSLGAAAGPSIGSLCSSLWGSRSVVLLDAVSFAVCGLLLCRVLSTTVVRDQPATGGSGPRGAPARLSLVHGARLVLGNPRLRWPVIALAWMNVLLFGTTFVLPTLVRDRGWSDGVLAACLTAVLIGGIAGSLVGARFRSERHFARYLALEPLCRAAALVVLWFASAPFVAVLAMFAFAVPQGLGRVARQSLLITEFPQDVRGRVMGSYQMLARGAMPAAPIVLTAAYATGGTTVFFLGNVVLLGVLGGILLHQHGRPRADHQGGPAATSPQLQSER